MSGGVDSSVAAAPPVEVREEVVGATLKLQECHETGGSRSCCGVDGITRAHAVAGQPDTEGARLPRLLLATGMSWLTPRPPADSIQQCTLEVRYRRAATTASVSCSASNTVAVTLHELVRAVTPVQDAVFYDCD